MPLDAKDVEQLLGRHPARRVPFDVLRDGLLEEVRARRVNVSREGDLELFAYSSACQYGQQWNLFSLMARGLILDVGARQIAATPFPKFFNLYESGMAAPAGPVEATEKFDGSLGLVFHHADQWRVATRGQFGSAQGRWATQRLLQHDLTALEPGATYLVEIVYRQNQVVIAYDFEGLVLLGGYDSAGDELRRAQLEGIAAAVGLRLAPPVAVSTIDALVEAAKQLPGDREGFVARFANGLRLKIKGPAYCRLHALACNCTPLGLWGAMSNGENLDALRRDTPEELHRDFDAIRAGLNGLLAALVEEVRRGHDAHARLNDAALGRLVQDNGSGLTEAQRKFLFAARKQDFLTAVQTHGEIRRRTLRLLRPDANRLAGYTPSTVASRLAEQELT